MIRPGWLAVVASLAAGLAAAQAPRDDESGSGPSRPDRRIVAIVGAEVIGLAEWTELIRIQMADLGPDSAPTREQVIALAAAALESMVARSLVFQEARERWAGPDAVRDREARSGRAWADRGLPELIRREGVADEGQLRAKLARRPASLAALREEFVVRAIAAELIAAERLDLGYEAYLAELRRRRPVVSVATSADLKRTGRRARPFGPAGR